MPQQGSGGAEITCEVWRDALETAEPTDVFRSVCDDFMAVCWADGAIIPRQIRVVETGTTIAAQITGHGAHLLVSNDPSPSASFAGPLLGLLSPFNGATSAWGSVPPGAGNSGELPEELGIVSEGGPTEPKRGAVRRVRFRVGVDGSRIFRELQSGSPFHGGKKGETGSCESVGPTAYAAARHAIEIDQAEDPEHAGRKNDISGSDHGMILHVMRS